MKLFLDQNLSRRLVSLLDSHYPNSTQASIENLEFASDLDIWEFAKSNGYVIVTKDSDFEELSILKGTPPKVIWIKVGNTQNKHIFDILVNNKQKIKELLSQDEINCVELYK